MKRNLSSVIKKKTKFQLTENEDMKHFGVYHKLDFLFLFQKIIYRINNFLRAIMKSISFYIDVGLRTAASDSIISHKKKQNEETNETDILLQTEQ